MKTAEKIRELLTAEPDLCGAEIARRVGCSREWVRHVCGKHGWKFRDGRRIGKNMIGKYPRTECRDCGRGINRLAKRCHPCRIAETWLLVICPDCGLTRTVKRSWPGKTTLCRRCWGRAGGRWKKYQRTEQFAQLIVQQRLKIFDVATGQSTRVNLSKKT